jgi:signal transduction histidine kinase
MSDPLAAHGLLILQDRLSLLGCNMEIRSSPGNGTIVVIDLPEDNFSVS